MPPRNDAEFSVSEELLAPFDLDALPPRSPTPLADTTLAVEWCSPSFLEAMDRIRRFARARHPMLVVGESGAGKTSFSEIAHRLGRHPEEAFIVVNCASLPEPLLESELFGHVKGAFTGAERDRAGLIRAAGAGTVFLDEIDKASPALQAALLHVLDRREVRSVGSHEGQPVEARFVFATNRDLTALTARGEFLPDLAFRISGMCVPVPPLRERREDFDLLLSLALRNLRSEEKLPGLHVGAEARDLLVSYDWPGNVRELFSTIRAAAHLLEDGPLIRPREIERASGASRLGSHTQHLREERGLPERVREFERREILIAMRAEGGNQTRAAARLGLTRRGLNKKIHRYRLLEQLGREGLRHFRRRSAANGAGPCRAGTPRE